jgi:hypothetical protein
LPFPLVPVSMIIYCFFITQSHSDLVTSSLTMEAAHSPEQC